MKAEEASIVRDSGRLMLELARDVAGFPKLHRYMLGSKLSDDAVELKLAAQEAFRSSRDRRRQAGSLSAGIDFPTHETVNHYAGEYVRGNVHTNTVEGYFSLLKRGLYGTFHHVSEAHLQRYATEFDFRWNHRKTTDAERAAALLSQVGGKRLKYRDSFAGA